MNAFDKLMRAVEQAMAKAKRPSPQPSPRRKPAKRRSAPKKVISPRVVSAPTRQSWGRCGRRGAGQHVQGGRDGPRFLVVHQLAVRRRRVGQQPALATRPGVHSKTRANGDDLHSSFMSVDRHLGRGNGQAGGGFERSRPAGTRGGHRKPAAYNPPRAPVDEAKYSAQVASFAPPAAPPFEWSITAERTAAVMPMDEVEALRRGILPDAHRHERGAFSRVLQPGEVPRLRQALDQASQASVDAEVYAGASHVKGERIPPTGKRADKGELGATIAKYRKSAHAGDDTTTGLPSDDKTEAA